MKRNRARRAEKSARKSPSVGKEKWYAEGLKFTCTLCGNCCSGDPGYVWATKEEIRRIAKFLGRTDGWLGKEHLRRVGLRYSLTEIPDGDCIFLARDGDHPRCSIYPVRPLQCRTWPFWSEMLASEANWTHAGKKCPGINVGKHHSLDEIEAPRKQKKW
ncbi:MAG: YkgJ family cysteine cluster protein [Phycisphaerales bacterium]|nr:MAG: YkgJ family cysteine cluster protein [Phycisphaerales bacterium]